MRQKCYAIIQRFFAAILCVSLCIPQVITRADDFSSWDEETQKDVIMMLELTDWDLLAGDLILDGTINTGLINRGLTKKVKNLKKTVQEALGSQDSMSGIRATEYTPVILAMIHVMNKDNLTISKKDPCCIKKYFDNTKTINEAKDSVIALYKRIQSMEKAYNNIHSQKADIKSNTNAIKIVYEAVMLGKPFAERESTYYTTQGCTEYYEENKETIMTSKRSSEPIVGFAGQVMKYLTFVDGESRTGISGSTNYQKWLSGVKAWCQMMEKQGDNGQKWSYASGNGEKRSYKESLKDTRKTNCALMVSHAMQYVGLLKTNQSFYSSSSKKTKYSGSGCKKQIQKNCQIISGENKTAIELIKAGKLQKGDIVLFNFQHTAVYYGEEGNYYVWYDAGGGTSKKPEKTWDSKYSFKTKVNKKTKKGGTAKSDTYKHKVREIIRVM